MFAHSDDDKIIYSEEEDVPEMYFVMEGIVGVGFSLVADGYVNDKYRIPIKMSAPKLICDYYVIN